MRGTGDPSPRYHKDQRRPSSSSKRCRPAPRPRRPGAARVAAWPGDPRTAVEPAPVRRRNVRRSIISMLVAGSALSTPLAAQSAVGFGIAATLGGGWQIEAGELGYVQAVHAGPLRYASIGGRFGAFVNEGSIVGGAQGFVAGLVLQARTGTMRLADVGNESNPS